MLTNTLDPDPARVVFVGNQKGGTGKSTVTANVAHEAARLGAKVLLIDLDPNWGLTGEHLGFDPRPDNTPTVSDLLRDGDEGSAAKYLLTAPSQWQPNPDLPYNQGGPLPGTNGAVAFIPGFVNLTSTVEHLASEPAAEMRLRDALTGVARHFDLVLIDTGPRADRISWLALQAAGHALIVGNPEDGSTKGVEQHATFLAGYARTWRLPYTLTGVICTRYDNRNSKVHQQGLDWLTEVVNALPESPVTARHTHTPTPPLTDEPWETGATVWPALAQSSRLLHAARARAPLAAVLNAKGTATTGLAAVERVKVAKVLAPYTQIAARLLTVTDGPTLPAIQAALTAHKETAP